MPRPPSRFTETCWKPSPRSRCELGIGGGFFLEVDPDSASHPPFLIPSAVSFPQEKTTSLPCDVAQDLRGLEAQLRRHEGLERELMGTEQQVSPGLAASPPRSPSGLQVCSAAFPHSRSCQPGPLCIKGRAPGGTGQALQPLGHDPSFLSPPCPQLQELLETGSKVQRLGPRPQAHVVQQRQQALVQAWETLKLRAEQCRAQLERAWLLARFHMAVRVLPSPGLCVCVCVCDAVSVHALMRPSSSGGKTG